MNIDHDPGTFAVCKCVKLRECFSMLLVAVEAVPNKDKDECNSLQPNCDGFIRLEPVENRFDHSRECILTDAPEEIRSAGQSLSTTSSLVSCPAAFNGIR